MSNNLEQELETLRFNIMSVLARFTERTGKIPRSIDIDSVSVTTMGDEKPKRVISGVTINISHD